MKPFIIILISIAIFMSIFSFFKKQNSEQVKINPLTQKEVFTLYKKTDKQVAITRAVTTNNTVFDLFSYEIDTSIPEGTKQHFVSVEHFTEQDLNSKKSELLKDYNWVPFKEKSVLFIQIQPTGFKDEMELLNKKQEMETKLNKIIEKNKLGEWLASDIGPGGGNILYSVSDIDTSLQLILEVLKQNQLDKNTVIGRRIMTEKADWFYEVIYPTDYSGDFNTM